METARAPRAIIALALAVFVTLAPFAAHAQSGDAATAEALFAAGRTAMERGDFETACAKFGESQRLDPGAGTLMNLAACNEQRGRLASAWENWREALGTLRSDDDRRPTAEARLGALEARLPRLDITLSPGAPANTIIERDGQLLGAAALGLPLPVDPGPHVIRASAEGYAERTLTISAEEGKTANVAIAPGPQKAAPAVPPAPLAPAPTAPATGTTTRTVGLIVAGSGAAVLIAGTITGILAIDRKNEIEDRCTKLGDRYTCDPQGVDAAHSGKAFAVTSSILVPVGLALGAVGATLFFTAPHDGPALHAEFGPAHVALSARGSF